MKIKRILALALTMAMLATMGLPAATAEEPVAEAAPVVQEAPKEEAPKAEAPKAEAPKAETPKAETKSEPKAETKSEPKAETKSEPKAETKSEPKAETKSEPKAETKSEPKAETKSETKAETKSETKAETKSETKEETKSETKEETKSETKAETKEETKSETKEETKSETKSETKEETKSETKEEAPKSETSSETKEEAPKADDAEKSETASEETGEAKSEESEDETAAEEETSENDGEVSIKKSIKKAAPAQGEEGSNTDGDTEEGETEETVEGETEETVEGETGKTGNDVIEEEPAKIAVNISYPGGDVSKEYDGKAFTPDPASKTFEGGLTVEYSVNGDAVKVGTSAKIIATVTGGEESKYNITNNPATLTITPKPVTVKYNDSAVEKKYDGKKFEPDNKTVEPVKDDKITVKFKVDGEDTKVGNAAKIVVDEFAGVKFGDGENTKVIGNYKVTRESTSLKITEGDMVITVTGKTLTSIPYDGQPHTFGAEGNYTLSSESTLFDPNKVTFTPPANVIATDASDTPYALGLTAAMFSYSDSSVNATFNIASDVTLKITKSDLKITVTGKTLDPIPYDGQSHTLSAENNYTLSSDSTFFDASKVTFAAPADVTVKDAADTPYALGLTTTMFGYNDDSVNATFEIASDVTLKITKSDLKITVTGKALDPISYDGQSHTFGAENNYTLSGDKTFFDESKVTFAAPADVTVKDAADTPYALGLTAEMFGYNDNSVNVAFEIASDVTLKITKSDLKITVTGKKLDPISYDGQPHTFGAENNYTLSADKTFFDESKVTFVAPADVTVTDASDTPYALGLTAAMFGYDDNSVNATFEIASDVTLEITKSDMVITVIGKTLDTVIYDAKPHTFGAEGNYTLQADQTFFDENKVTLNAPADVTETEVADEPYALGLTKEMFSYGDTSVKAKFEIASDVTLKIDPLPINFTIEGSTKNLYYKDADYTLSFEQAVLKDGNYSIETTETPKENYADAVDAFTYTHTVKSKTAKEVGEYSLDITADKFSYDDNNYDVTISITDAKLNIAALPITLTVTGTANECFYDTKEHPLTYADHASTAAAIASSVDDAEVDGYKAEGDYAAAADNFKANAEKAYYNDDAVLKAVDPAPVKADDYKLDLKADQYETVNNNYDVTYVIDADATLTIKPLPVTVTVGAVLEKIYGASNTDDIDGSNDNSKLIIVENTAGDEEDYTNAETELKDKLILTRDIAKQDVGTYPVALKQRTGDYSAETADKDAGYDDNFRVTYAGANYTIKPLHVTVTVASEATLEKSYGAVTDTDTKLKAGSSELVALVTPDATDKEPYTKALDDLKEKELKLRRASEGDAGIVMDEGVGDYTIYLEGKNGYSAATAGDTNEYNVNYLVSFEGDKFTINPVLDEIAFVDTDYDTRQATFALRTSIDPSLEEKVKAKVTIHPTAKAPSYLNTKLADFVVEQVGTEKSGIVCAPIGYTGEGAQWNGWLPASTVLTTSVKGLKNDAEGEYVDLTSTPATTTIVAHKTSLSSKYVTKNEFREGNGSILADEGSILFTGPAGEYLMVIFGGANKKYGPFQIGADGTYNFKLEAEMFDSGSYGAVVTGKSKWTGYLIDSVDGNGGTNPNLDCPAITDAVAIDNGPSSSISAPGFLNRADSFQIVLPEEPGSGKPVTATVAGLPARTFEAVTTQKEYAWDDFFSAWSGGPTLLAPGASLTVSYVDRVGHECSGSASAGRSTAQRDISIIATPSMKREKGKLKDMVLKLQGTAVNFEQINLTAQGGSATATTSGSPAYGHTKMGKWSATMPVVPELSLGEVAFTVNGTYVNINGGGESNTITYRGLYQPLVVVSPAEPRDNVIYGFMDPDATVYISIEHGDASIDAFDSKSNPDMFELGVTGKDKNSSIGYFLFTYGSRFQPGDTIRVWYVGADGIKDDYVYETVVPDLENFSGETNAEVLGVSLTEWNEEGDSKQAFVLPVKLSDIEANPADYVGLPMIAFGGYEVGSFSIVSENGKLKVTEMTVDSGIEQSEGSIRFFTEKPAIADLANGGQRVKVDQAFSVPEDTDIVWVYAKVPVELDEYTIASHDTGITFSGQENPSTRVSENNDEWYKRYNKFQNIIEETTED